MWLVVLVKIVLIFFNIFDDYFMVNFFTSFEPSSSHIIWIWTWKLLKLDVLNDRWIVNASNKKCLIDRISNKRQNMILGNGFIFNNLVQIFNLLIVVLKLSTFTYFPILVDLDSFYFSEIVISLLNMILISYSLTGNLLHNYGSLIRIKNLDHIPLIDKEKLIFCFIWFIVIFLFVITFYQKILHLDLLTEELDMLLEIKYSAIETLDFLFFFILLVFV